MARIGGVFFIAVAVVIALHAAVEPLYHASTDAQPYSPAWDVLDPLMVVTVVFGTVLAWRRKRGVDGAGDAPVTREYLTANVLFYGFLFIAVLLLRNWFDQLSPAFSGVGPDTVNAAWLVVDAVLPLLSGATGVALLRDAPGAADG